MFTILVLNRAVLQNVALGTWPPNPTSFLLAHESDVGNDECEICITQTFLRSLNHVRYMNNRFNKYLFYYVNNIFNKYLFYLAGALPTQLELYNSVMLIAKLGLT
jgi:hypothetical protein